MANFATHLKASAITSTALASVVLTLEVTSLTQLLGLFTLGTLAGLIPDLDSDKSRSLNSLFTIFALVLASFIMLFLNLNSLIAVWLVLLATYGTIMLIVKPIFEHFTVHRGSFHSIAALILVTLTSISLGIFLNVSVLLSLFASIFVFTGMLTHLILDECYSVDIENKELKSSFGTALKLFDTRYGFASLTQLILISINVYYLWLYQSELLNAFSLICHDVQQITLLPDLKSDGLLWERISHFLPPS